MKLFLLIGTSLSLISMKIHAETCTPTPDCKTLGYTETSCPDGDGIKCPWNTSLMYCGAENGKCMLKSSCQIGDVLYSDKKCYECPNAYTLPFPGLSPIGVVFEAQKAVNLVDLGPLITDDFDIVCANYNTSGITGWRLPDKDELNLMYINREAVENGYYNAKFGAYFVSQKYWSTTRIFDQYGGYYVVNPIDGSSARGYDSKRFWARCVLSL